MDKQLHQCPILIQNKKLKWIFVSHANLLQKVDLIKLKLTVYKYSLFIKGTYNYLFV